MSKIVDEVESLVRRNTRTIVTSVCVVIFVWLLQELNEGTIMKLDAGAYWLIVEHLRFDWLTPIMEGFTDLATPIVILAMLVVFAAFAPGKRPGACAAVNLACVTGLNLLLKNIVQRPRPDGFRLVAESGYSFPSGHSMVAMAFFGLFAWFVWHYEKDRVQRFWWCLAFALLVVMVGLSRIYLGVHYASDVLAGFCVSMAWLAFYTKVVCPLFLPEEGRHSAGSRISPTSEASHDPSSARDR